MRKYLTDSEKLFIMLVKNKLFISEIAEKLNCDRGTIYRFLHNNKLSYKKHYGAENNLTETEEKVMSNVV